jgi:hypothetical protein
LTVFAVPEGIPWLDRPRRLKAMKNWDARRGRSRGLTATQSNLDRKPPPGVMLNDVTVRTGSEWANRLNMRWSIPTMAAYTEKGYSTTYLTGEQVFV